jgi:hypothetical protein
MTADTDDPLEDLEVGETQRVELTEEQSFWFTCPDEFAGFDRTVENIDIDAEIVFDENGEEVIRTTYSADMTRNVPKLPYWWDDGLQLDADGTLEREKPTPLRWQAVKAAALVGPFAIAAGITELMMRGISGEITVNDEPLMYEPWTAAIAMALILLATLAIRELPPQLNGGRTA